MAKFRQPPQSASEATIVSKTIASNGTYYASADSADGYNPVVVEVPGEHATIVSKNIVANGTYNASSDSADGYNPVTVSVPEKVIVSKNITSNGTYNASSDSADGYNPVTVNVPESVIVSKSITANGTYNASSDSADGYNPVTVNVPGPVLGTKNITANGTYSASSEGYDGFSSVTVNVSGGALATITVSYTSDFYNMTMTCTDGITTYSETTTSAGTTVFSVNASGTWTITCNGVSRTVDVVLDYTTQMVITQTVTVYSAASDTVSFTDVTGAKTVTTNASGQGSVSITFIPPSANITFTSSVAKNPNNLSQYYSKTVSITNATTEVKVMPDTALYWYGYYDTSNLEDNGVTVDYAGTFTPQSVTHNTRDLLLDASSGSPWFICVNSKNTINGTIKFLANSTTQYNGYGVNSAKKMGNEIIDNSFTSTITLYSVNASNQYFYFGYWALGSRSVIQTLYALWYE